MKDKIKTLEVLRADLGEKQFRSTMIRIVAISIINQWIEKRSTYSKGLSRVQVVERINLTLRNYGIEPVSYSYIKQLSQ